MKKILSLLLVLSMSVMILAGCGDGAAPEKKEEGKAEPAKEEKVEKVTLRFWHAWQGDEADKLQVYVDKYNEEHPEVFVEALSGTNAEKQMIALSGGDSFDIGYQMDYRMPLWGREGMLLPLNDLIADSGFNKDDVIDAELDLMNFDGNIYGLPFTVDALQLYYNKDILEELGVEVPKTWDELYDVALKAVKVDDNGDYTRLGFLNNYPWKNEEAFTYINGADWVDRETGENLIMSKDHMEAMNFKAKFHMAPDYDTEKIIKFKSGFGNYASAENAFLKGQMAFAIDGEWFPTFIDMYKPDFNYGIAPIPYNPDKPEFKDRGFIGGGALYIPKTCTHPKEAFDFIKYLIDDAQLPFCIDKGSLPSTKSALADPMLVEKAPTMKPFIDLALAGKLVTPVKVKYLTELNKSVNDAAQRVYDGEMTVEESFKQAEEEVNKVAEKVGK